RSLPATTTASGPVATHLRHGATFTIASIGQTAERPVSRTAPWFAADITTACTSTATRSFLGPGATRSTPNPARILTGTAHPTAPALEVVDEDVGVLEMRPACEKCSVALPPGDEGAFICSYE